MVYLSQIKRALIPNKLIYYMFLCTQRHKSHSYSVLSEASPGWKSLNSLNFVLRLAASEDVFGIVSLVLNHRLSSPKLNVVSDDRQSIKSRQLSVGIERFPFLFGKSFVHALMCWFAQRSVRKKRNGVHGGGNRGARNERKGKTSVLRFDDSEGSCHIAMNI